MDFTSRVVDSETYRALAKESEQFNRGPSDEIISSLDVNGHHVLHVLMPCHVDFRGQATVRCLCLTKLPDGCHDDWKDKYGAVDVIMDIEPERFHALQTVTAFRATKTPFKDLNEQVVADNSGGVSEKRRVHSLYKKSVRNRSRA